MTPPSPAKLQKKLRELDPETFERSGVVALLPVRGLKERGRAGSLKAYICRKDLEICGFLPPTTEPCRRHHLMIVSPQLAQCLLTSSSILRWGPWVLAYAQQDQPAAPVFVLSQSLRQLRSSQPMSQSFRQSFRRSDGHHQKRLSFSSPFPTEGEAMLRLNRNHMREQARITDEAAGDFFWKLTARLEKATQALTQTVEEIIPQSEALKGMDAFAKAAHVAVTQSPLGRLKSVYLLWAGALALFGQFLYAPGKQGETADPRWAEQEKINARFEESFRLLHEKRLADLEANYEAKILEVKQEQEERVRKLEEKHSAEVQELQQKYANELQEIRHDVRKAFRTPKTFNWDATLNKIRQAMKLQVE